MTMPKRFSLWQQTLPFSLNNDYFGYPAETEHFDLPNTESVPILAQFDVYGSDPSGSRHLTTHPSFLNILASGLGLASLSFEQLDLNATDISTGSGVSNTKTFLFRISKVTSPGITTINNIKVWASDMSDFLLPETCRILYKTSTPWLSGFKFTSSDMGNKSLWMDTSLPEMPNLKRTGGFNTIYGSGDMDVSEWVYIALAASGTLPLGEYHHVIDGMPSGFKIRVSYNISNLFSIQD